MCLKNSIYNRKFSNILMIHLQYSTKKKKVKVLVKQQKAKVCRLLFFHSLLIRQ